jgi:hypothetical protein
MFATVACLTSEKMLDVSFCHLGSYGQQPARWVAGNALGRPHHTGLLRCLSSKCPG